eukprot:TRINITY_DN21309_c0_g1_i1.p1 TRINITY_DN21309_c0_g1~~TRINITY_DN21309_c0_g1_i1.p1  ORF type:complete len:316 (+),score=60.02 TRINITY_DN21309_c0_g1_i1:144-1091(+)
MAVAEGLALSTQDATNLNSINSSKVDEEKNSSKVDEENVMEMEVHTMAGESKVLKISASTPLQNALAAVEKLLGIPANTQRWLAGTEEVKIRQASVLADTTLCDGDSITVVSGFTPLQPLPTCFVLEFRTVRERGCSSAFIMWHLLRGDISNRKLRIEPWRKNDHDTFDYDFKADKVQASTCHWMGGTKTSEGNLGGKDFLDAVVKGWDATFALPVDESERWWLPGGVEPTHTPSKASGEYPKYDAVPGWFIEPEEGCVELKVDIPLPPREHKVVRILINADGKPLRAALCGCKVNHLHQEIEEFTVHLDSADSM